MYVLLNGGNAAEIIPDFDPAFPGVPVNKRYASDFLENCVYVPDDEEVIPGREYIAKGARSEKAVL